MIGLLLLLIGDAAAVAAQEDIPSSLATAPRNASWYGCMCACKHA